MNANEVVSLILDLAKVEGRYINRRPQMIQLVEEYAKQQLNNHLLNEQNKKQQKGMLVRCDLPVEGHNKGKCSLVKGHPNHCWFPNMWNDM